MTEFIIVSRRLNFASKRQIFISGWIWLGLGWLFYKFLILVNNDLLKYFEIAYKNSGCADYTIFVRQIFNNRMESL